MDRRHFIRILSHGVVAATLLPKHAAANHPPEKRPTQFVFAQIKYRGGDWNPHPLAVTPLMEELIQRASVESATARREVAITDRDLFNYPFLYITGRYEFEPFTREEIEILRLFLSYGGFFLLGGALGPPGYWFDKAVRR